MIEKNWKTSFLRVALLQILWHKFCFLQTLVFWDCVFLKEVPPSYRNLQKRGSSMHILMKWMHYVFLWDSEKSCIFVWIWKGSIHNYNLLVSDPCGNSMSFQLVIIQCLLLRVGFLTRATIEHPLVFHPNQRLWNQKKRCKTSQNAKFNLKKNEFFFETSKINLKINVKKWTHSILNQAYL